MKECCEKSGGRCGCAGKEKLISITEQKKASLRDHISKYEKNDLRFAYFRSKKSPDIYITAVSILDRKAMTLTVAFSFSSPKDSFCKLDGKIKCFERLADINHPYRVVVPWLDDGLLCIFLAYNRLAEKPEKLAKSKFNDLIYTGTPRYIMMM